MSDEFKLVPVEPTEEMLNVMHDRVVISVNTRKQEANILNDKAWWAAVVAAAPQPPAIGDDLDDALRDLASSACQMALDNGINEDAFLRLARSVRQRIEANKPPALGGEPEVFGLIYRVNGEVVLEPVGDPHIKDGMPVYSAECLAPLQAEAQQSKTALQALNDLYVHQRDSAIALKTQRDALEALLLDIDDLMDREEISPGYDIELRISKALRSRAERAALSKPAGSDQV